MITAETLTTMTTFTAAALQRAVGKAADDVTFTGARFLGITNGGQFCYSVVYRCESFEGTDSTKVYLTYDPAAGKVIADTDLTVWA
jgi:hypothetical protein